MSWWIFSVLTLRRLKLIAIDPQKLCSVPQPSFLKRGRQHGRGHKINCPYYYRVKALVVVVFLFAVAVAAAVASTGAKAAARAVALLLGLVLGLRRRVEKR